MRFARSWPNSRPPCSTSIRASRNSRHRSPRSKGQSAPKAERLAAQLDNDAKVAGDRLETLTASLNTVKKQASQTNGQDVQLRALEREAKTERDLLESYLAKYREATARDNINAAPPEARIISRASPAIKPDYPEESADCADRGLRRFRIVGGFHRDRGAAGDAFTVSRLSLCAAADGHAYDARRFAVHDAGRFARHARRANGGAYGRAHRAEPASGR